MEDELKKLIEDKTHEFLSNEIINPVLKIHYNYYDERCYAIFTLEMADLFEEHLPEYFALDYHSKIGQYFFSSLYGDYLPERILIDVIMEEVNFVYVDDEADRIPRRFRGLEVYFSDRIDTLKTVAAESVENMNINLDLIKALIINITLKSLNKEYI